MLPVKSVTQYAEADALAIDTLFKRIAERGRKIRIQKQADNVAFVERSGDCEFAPPALAVTNESRQIS